MKAKAAATIFASASLQLPCIPMRELIWGASCPGYRSPRDPLLRLGSGVESWHWELRLLWPLLVSSDHVVNANVSVPDSFLPFGVYWSGGTQASRQATLSNHSFTHTMQKNSDREKKKRERKNMVFDFRSTIWFIIIFSLGTYCHKPSFLHCLMS